MAVQQNPATLGQRALEAWVRSTGRSWWQAGYQDGKVVNEFETTTGSRVLALIGRAGSTSRWEELPKKGLRALRLLTPIGQVGYLEVTRDYALFQLKVGGISVGINGPGERWCDAHVIGKVLDIDGNCELMACEYTQDRKSARLVGPIQDNVTDLKYRQVGALNLDVLGIRL